MICPILDVSPNFTPVWNEFLEEWKSEVDLPLYLLLADLARYINTLVNSKSDNELKKIFSVIEGWHLEGDSYVKEAATVGLLENLQNINVVGDSTPEIIVSYLLPESKKWWVKVNEFWTTEKLISE